MYDIPAFWFESSALFQIIDSKGDFDIMKELSPDWRKANLVIDSDEDNMPNFGFKREHQGPETLGDWYDRQKTTRIKDGR